MKIIKQLVSFGLGVTVGVCLYSLLKLRPISPTLLSNTSTPTRMQPSGTALQRPWVQRHTPAAVPLPKAAERQESAAVATSPVVELPDRLTPVPLMAKHTRPPVRKKALVPVVAPPRGREHPVEVSSAPLVAIAAEHPAPPEHVVPVAAQVLAKPNVFKTLGYVDKGGGDVEAIILQENQIQVVHIGEVIAGRYRVTRISPDSVDAVAESPAPATMVASGVSQTVDLTASTALPQAMSAQADVTAHTAFAPGGAEGAQAGVVLSTEIPLPTSAIETQAGPSTGYNLSPVSSDSQHIESNSLGFVQMASGKVESVLAEGNSVRLVPESSTLEAADRTLPATLSAMGSSGLILPAVMPSLGRSTVVRPDDLQIGPQAPSVSAAQPRMYPMPSADSASAESLASIQPILLPNATRKVDGTLDHVDSPAHAMHDVSTDGPADLRVMIKPIGFVVEDDGELEAILAGNDQVYVVRQGDLFGGHYRAISVSADVVEAVEDQPGNVLPWDLPSANSDLLSADAGPVPSLPSSFRHTTPETIDLAEVNPEPRENPPRVRRLAPERITPTVPPHSLAASSRQSASHRDLAGASAPSPNTYVFQTLGYVETGAGAVRAVVADGSEVYLVREGETFAGQYLATSVDPFLVLAVNAPQAQRNSFAAQTDSHDQLASNLLGWHFPLAAWTEMQATSEAGPMGSFSSMNLGLNLLDSTVTGVK